MGRSFSSTFGFDDSFLRLAQLLFEMPNPSMKRSQISLGCEVQHARDSLSSPFQCPFRPTAEPKRLHHDLLNLRFPHQSADARVLEKLEEAVFQSGHGCQTS